MALLVRSWKHEKIACACKGCASLLVYVQGAASGSQDEAAPVQPFKYKHLGSMATVGGTSAVLQLGGAGTGSDSFKIGRKRFSVAGFISWVAWRSAYLTRLGTVRARLQVMFDWTITLL